MSDFISIVPKPVITTTNLVGFKIDGVNVDLFRCAYVRVIIYDAPMSINRIDTVQLTQEEYSLWSNDDTYIIDVICSKLGFTKELLVDTTTTTTATSGDVPVDTTTTSGDVPLDTTTTSGDVPLDTTTTSGDVPVDTTTTSGDVPVDTTTTSGDVPLDTTTTSGDVPVDTTTTTSGDVHVEGGSV